MVKKPWRGASRVHALHATPFAGGRADSSVQRRGVGGDHHRVVLEEARVRPAAGVGDHELVELARQIRGHRAADRALGRDAGGAADGRRQVGQAVRLERDRAARGAEIGDDAGPLRRRHRLIERRGRPFRKLGGERFAAVRGEGEVGEEAAERRGRRALEVERGQRVLHHLRRDGHALVERLGVEHRERQGRAHPGDGSGEVGIVRGVVGRRERRHRHRLRPALRQVAVHQRLVDVGGVGARLEEGPGHRRRHRPEARVDGRVAARVDAVAAGALPIQPGEGRGVVEGNRPVRVGRGRRRRRAAATGAAGGGGRSGRRAARALCALGPGDHPVELVGRRRSTSSRRGPRDEERGKENEGSALHCQATVHATGHRRSRADG